MKRAWTSGQKISIHKLSYSKQKILTASCMNAENMFIKDSFVLISAFENARISDVHIIAEIPPMSVVMLEVVK